MSAGDEMTMTPVDLPPVIRQRAEHELERLLDAAEVISDACRQFQYLTHAVDVLTAGPDGMGDPDRFAMTAAMDATGVEDIYTVLNALRSWIGEAVDGTARHTPYGNAYALQRWATERAITA